jgi:UDP-N-acetylmuramate--alanine ligase
MPGLHNVSNALAAITVGLTISSAFGRDYPIRLSFQQIQEALANFQGIHRRFEILGEVKGIMVVDDYAHNPAKLRAVFQAAKTGYNRRVVGIVQPHRYQRVQSLADEFAVSFSDTDLLLLTPIYAAEETPLNGVSGKMLADSIRAQGHPNVIYMSDLVVEQIVDLLQPNDIVITAGAGDIWQVGRKLLKHLKDAN